MGNEEVTWGDTIAATVIALVLTCRCFKLSSELMLSLDERPLLYLPTTLRHCAVVPKQPPISSSGEASNHF
jgi:hypothetical protein